MKLNKKKTYAMLGMNFDFNKQPSKLEGKLLHRNGFWATFQVTKTSHPNMWPRVGDRWDVGSNRIDKEVSSIQLENK